MRVPNTYKVYKPIKGTYWYPLLVYNDPNLNDEYKKTRKLIFIIYYILIYK